MSNKPKAYRKIVHLTFPPDMSGKPVICNLTRKFDLDFNILQSDINPRQQGSMTLEISGLEEAFNQGVSYLKENRIMVSSVAQKVFRNDDKCIHCGVCTAICPTKALKLDLKTRKITFDVEKCSACGRCTRVCPVQAMNMDVEDNGTH